MVVPDVKARNERAVELIALDFLGFFLFGETACVIPIQFPKPS